MKKILLVLLFGLPALSWSSAASASPCGASSFTTYASLGATGCTIGSFVFSDFVLLPAQAGAQPSSAITVTPIVVGTTMVGVTFSVSPTASGGLFYDDLINYKVTGLGANLVGATVDFTGTSSSGDAVVSVAERICLGGTFGADGVSGCPPSTTRDLIVVDTPFTGADPAYSLTFDPTASLSVSTDIAYDSGSGFAGPSSSTIASAINRFDVAAAVPPTTVPEPSDGLLLAAGVLAYVLASRRRLRTRS